MKQIVYAGGSFVTSDEIAGAVLEYAAALANADRAATLLVPTVAESGEPIEVQVLVGPASQLMAEVVEHPGPAPDGVEFLASVRERIDRLRHPIVQFSGESAVDWDI
jgi:hypothetical protein